LGKNVALLNLACFVLAFIKLPQYIFNHFVFLPCKSSVEILVLINLFEFIIVKILMSNEVSPMKWPDHYFHVLL